MFSRQNIYYKNRQKCDLELTNLRFLETIGKGVDRKNTNLLPVGHVDGPRLVEYGEQLSQSDEQLTLLSEHVAKTGEQIAQPDEHLTLPGEQIAKTGEQLAANVKQKAEPGEQLPEPGEQLAQPDEQLTLPGEQLPKTDEQIAQPDEQLTLPDEKLATPSEQLDQCGEQPTEGGAQLDKEDQDVIKEQDNDLEMTEDDTQKAGKQQNQDIALQYCTIPVLVKYCTVQ